MDGSETVSNEYQKLYYHYLGTDQSEDVIVAEFDDPHYRMQVYLYYLFLYLFAVLVEPTLAIAENTWCLLPLRAARTTLYILLMLTRNRRFQKNLNCIQS